jgi:acetyl esterase/lipase
LIPKGLGSGQHPVIVNIHGGFYATAHALFAPFFAPWTIGLALDNKAIIVSADYRLLPTPNGVADQLEDLEDFWRWTRHTLPSVLGNRCPQHSLDFSRLLLTGASAGGYYASQLAISHPDEVSVLGIAYPAVDLKDELWTGGPKPGAPTVFRTPEADILSKEECITWVEARRDVVASKGGFELTPFCVGLTQHGDFKPQMFEHDQVRLKMEDLPLERLRNGAKLPKNV